MEYQQLEKSSQLSLVRARLKELERQHFTLAMRVSAPDLSQPINDQDQLNLAKLTEAIDILREQEQTLAAG